MVPPAACRGILSGISESLLSRRQLTFNGVFAAQALGFSAHCSDLHSQACTYVHSDSAPALLSGQASIYSPASLSQLQTIPGPSGNQSSLSMQSWICQFHTSRSISTSAPTAAKQQAGQLSTLSTDTAMESAKKLPLRELIQRLPELQHVPRVLLEDPWQHEASKQFHKQAMQACLQLLRNAGPNAALTADQVYAELHSLQPKGQTPLVHNRQHVIELLEYLRDKRLIYGSPNPDTELRIGHPRYPYRYTALPFQVEFKGSPIQHQKRMQKQQAEALERAKKRLRRGKTPYPIFRPVAQSSIYQHALVYEQMQSPAQQHLYNSNLKSMEETANRAKQLNGASL